MDIDNRDLIRRRYDFLRWPAPAAVFTGPAGHLPVVGPGTPLPLLKRTPYPGGDYLDLFGDESGAEVAVRVEAYADAAAAREGLIRHLTTSVVTRLPNAADKGLPVGEVGFAALDDPPSAVVFVRGRLVIDISSVGRAPYPISAFAALFDDLAARWSRR